MKAFAFIMQAVVLIGRASAVPTPPSPIAISAKAAVAARIVEEDTGEGIEGVPVVCILPTSKSILGDMGYTAVTNNTDKNGEVHFSGTAYDDKVEYFVADRIGYYPQPYLNVQFTNMTEALFKKWLPYDEVQTVTLQKIGKTIPLFVKEARPKRNQDLTTSPDRKFFYDLVKGDWMPPFGKGEHSDIEFTLLPRENLGIGRGPSGIEKPYFKDTISVAFVGDGNGVVKLVPPPNATLKVRTAPENGYQKGIRIWSGLTKTMQCEDSTDKEACHAFRIRTIRNERGEIIDSHYGKVYGDFAMKFNRDSTPRGVAFTYYLNLTPNDRNLEWDMEHNLCPVRGSFNLP